MRRMFSREATGRPGDVAGVRRWLGALALAALAACETETEPTKQSCDGPAGTICTWIGDGEAGFDGDGNPLLASQLYWPIELTLGEGGKAWVLDWNNHRVREVVDGTLRTVIGSDQLGDGPADLADKTEPGAIGTTVNLNHPTQLLPQVDGSMLLVAWHNHKLRRYDPATGRVVITCGSAPGYKGDGGSAHKAQLDQPQAVAPDGLGGLYVLDQRNQVVRQIDAQGIMHTVAGTPQSPGFAGDGGDPLQAKFSFPTGSNPSPGGWVTTDAEGRIYVSDTLNHRIRRIDRTKNTIETIAGTGEAGFGGDGGPATAAKLNNPRKLTVGPDGRLYVADELNNRIRAIDLTTGVITTVVGTGEAAFSGDGGPATAAAIWRPSAISFSPEGELYVVDTYNHRIRRVLGTIGASK